MKTEKKIATRESYGQALLELGAINPDIVVLDADLSLATKTCLFKEAFPERFFDLGIAESNMVGVGAGLAATGKIPFVSSFAMFSAGRAYEQIRNSVAYPDLNVKIAASHGGISVGEDGGTHQCIEDFALMRVIPGMTVICPADDIEARAAVKAAAQYEGPVYMRFGRYPVSVIHDSEDFEFKIGKGEVLREGKDVTIFVTGLPVKSTLEAAERLSEDGLSVEVINLSTIKPIDTALILESASKTGKVITIEEHNILGGLGSAVAEVLSEELPVPVKRIGVNDQFGRSGSPDDLIRAFELDTQGIYNQIKKNLF